ncbi:MAG: class I SAM-dependent methyltransferase [Candidatus Binataceae bacterium]
MPSASRFRSTAPFYARFRPRYPAALYARIAERCELDGSGRLLDLGCGPAFIAIGMARYFRELLGMDPDPEMLVMARHEASFAGVTLKLTQGGSEDLDAALGSFAMAAMGRSFHWMDRDATLRKLNELIAPHGCVALLGERALDVRENSWKTVLNEAAKKWAPEQAQAREFRRGPAWEKNETVLSRSRFSRIERLGVAYSRETSLDELVGRAYSMSVTSPAVLGQNRAAFEHELRTGLSRLEPSGRFVESVEAEALLAWRTPGQ